MKQLKPGNYEATIEDIISDAQKTYITYSVGGRMQGRSKYIEEQLRKVNKNAIIIRKGKNIYMPARHTKTLVRYIMNMEEE